MPMHCNDGQPGASVRSDGGETLQKRQQQLSKQLSAPLPSSVPRSRRASEDFSRSQSVATRPSLLTPSAASKKSHAPVRHCKGPAPQPPGGPPKSMAYVRFTPGAAIGTSASSGSKIARVSESPDRTCHRKVSAERRVSAESGNIATLLADDARIKAIKQREEELFTQRQQETGRYHSTTASDDSIASGSTTKLGYPPAVIRPNGRRPERPKSLPSGVQRRVTFPAAPFAVPGEEPGTGRSELGDGGGIYACIDDEQTRERMPTVDELKAAGIRERLVPRRSDVGAKDLAIWGGAGSIEFPLTLRLRHSDSLGNRTVAEGSEITLCAVRSKELARLVGIDADQQSISYEPVESSAGNTNTLYEVVRGHQAPGSRPNYLWNTTSYSNLQQCLTNSPSKRRIRLTDDFVLNNDIMLKKGEEFIVACDTVSMDTLSVTHIPCWRLSALSEVARAMATAGTVSAHSSGHTHSPSWQTVELVMLPLNDDMGVQECVNSQLLRLSQLAQRYCTQLPMQIIAYEHVPVQPAVFARSGDAAAQLHISTSSQLSLEAMTTETMLLLLIADHPVLVSDRHTFRCDLVPASSPPSASQLCRALAGPAAQSLMTQQYGGKAPPTMTPVMTLERQAFPEEDYMDMRELTEHQQHAEAEKDTSTAPYMQAPVVAQIACMSESVEESTAKLVDDEAVPRPPELPPNRPEQHRPSSDALKPRSGFVPSPLSPTSPPPVDTNHGYDRPIITTGLRSQTPPGSANTVVSTTQGMSSSLGNSISFLAAATAPSMPSYNLDSTFTAGTSATLGEPHNRKLNNVRRSDRADPFAGNAITAVGSVPITADMPATMTTRKGAKRGLSIHSGVTSKVNTASPNMKRRCQDDIAAYERPFAAVDTPTSVVARTHTGRVRNADYRRSRDDLYISYSDASSTLSKDPNSKQSRLRAVKKWLAPLRKPRSETAGNLQRMASGSSLEEEPAHSGMKSPSATVTSPNAPGTPEPTVKPRSKTIDSLLDGGKSEKRAPPPRPSAPAVSSVPPKRPTYTPTKMSTSDDVGTKSTPKTAGHTARTSDSDTASTASRQLFSSGGSSSSVTSATSAPPPGPANPTLGRPTRPVSPSRTHTTSIHPSPSKQAPTRPDAKPRSVSTSTIGLQSVREPLPAAQQQQQQQQPHIQQLETILPSASAPCDSSYLSNEVYAVPRVDQSGQPIAAALPNSPYESPFGSPTEDTKTNLDEIIEEDSLDVTQQSQELPQTLPARGNPTFNPPPAPSSKPPTLSRTAVAVTTMKAASSSNSASPTPSRPPAASTTMKAASSSNSASPTPSKKTSDPGAPPSPSITARRSKPNIAAPGKLTRRFTDSQTSSVDEELMSRSVERQQSTLSSASDNGDVPSMPTAASSEADSTTVNGDAVKQTTTAPIAANAAAASAAGTTGSGEAAAHAAGLSTATPASAGNASSSSSSSCPRPLSTTEPIYSYSTLQDDGYGMLDNTPPTKAPRHGKPPIKLPKKPPVPSSKPSS